MKTITTTLLALCMVTLVMGQSYMETEKRELAFESRNVNNVFYLSNINGSIKVEGYDGDKIMLEAAKTVIAKNQERLDRSRTELSLGVIDRVDTIIVYIQGPCGTFTNKDFGYRKNRGSGWGYQWNDCDFDYDFKYDFTLKVPRNLNVYLSTINDGNVEVNGVGGALNVNNINGSITLEQVSGKARVHTINGDVNVRYKELPKEASSYYTLNGDINAYYPKGLRASMTFKSFNGDFYTNIAQVEQRQALVKKKKTDSDEGLSYKVDSRSAIDVGGGGVALDFETFNGDVFVKEQ